MTTPVTVPETTTTIIVIPPPTTVTLPATTTTFTHQGSTVPPTTTIPGPPMPFTGSDSGFPVVVRFVLHRRRRAGGRAPASRLD